MSAEETPEVVAPRFSVVAGNPSAEDLAALTVVMSLLRRGRGRPHAPENRAPAGGWKSYWHLMGHGFIAGREAWRSTFRR